MINTVRDDYDGISNSNSSVYHLCVLFSISSVCISCACLLYLCLYTYFSSLSLSSYSIPFMCSLSSRSYATYHMLVSCSACSCLNVLLLLTLSCQCWLLLLLDFKFSLSALGRRFIFVSPHFDPILNEKFISVCLPRR